MPFVDLNTIVVTGTYLSFDATPGWGTVTFESPTNFASLLDPTGIQVVVPTKTVAKLDENGHIAVTLPATDDPDLPLQGWTFTVTERIADQHPNRYYIEVPYLSPAGTFDLSDAPHVDPSIGVLTPISVGNPLAMLWQSGEPMVWQSGETIEWQSV